MSHPELDQELLPDRHAEVNFERIRGMTWLILAEADHPLGFHEIAQAARKRQDPKVEKLPTERLRQAVDQERLLGHVEILAFRNRARLAPSGLAELERTNEFYCRRCATAAGELVRTAAERAEDQRPGTNHTRVRFDNTLSGGLSVSWTNFEVGLVRLDGTDLMESEQPLLPDHHRRFGTLHLVERRLEFGDLEGARTAETLVFDYPQADPDRGLRRYQGEKVPNMQTEIHRDRVSLGTLRQLTAELGG